MTTKPNDEFDVPFGGLKTSGRVILDDNRIVAVHAEARFVREDNVLKEADAVKIWKKLGKENFPSFEPTEQNQQNVVITPQGAEVSQLVVNKGWILSDADKTHSVMLMPSAVNIRALKYTRFSESIGIPFSNALAAYADVTKVSLVSRIGLRYINRLTDSEALSPTFWGPKVKPAFAGLIDGDLGVHVTGSIQQLQMKLEPTVLAIINSGVFQDTSMGGAYSFLVDIDVFREQAMDFEVAACANFTRKLNRTSVALFEQTLTKEFMGEMGTSGNVSESGGF